MRQSKNSCKTICNKLQNYFYTNVTISSRRFLWMSFKLMHSEWQQQWKGRGASRKGKGNMKPKTIYNASSRSLSMSVSSSSCSNFLGRTHTHSLYCATICGKWRGARQRGNYSLTRLNKYSYREYEQACAGNMHIYFAYICTISRSIHAIIHSFIHSFFRLCRVSRAACLVSRVCSELSSANKFNMLRGSARQTDRLTIVGSADFCRLCSPLFAHPF